MKYLFTLMITISILGCFYSSEKQKEYLIKKFENKEIQVEIKIFPKKPNLMDKIDLIVKAFLDKDYILTMPDFSESLRAFDIYHYNEVPLKIENNKKVHQYNYELEALVSGKIEILPFKFILSKKDSTIDFKTDIISIEIESAGGYVKDKNLKDIRTPFDYIESNIALITMILISFIVLLIFLFILLKKRDKTIIKQKTPEEIALERLKYLLELNYIEKGDYKIFYFEISMITREFIENKFSIKAPELTTEEFLENISNLNTFDIETKSNLKRFMNACDLVKYAKLKPEKKDIDEIFKSAKKFIGLNEDNFLN